MSEAVVLLGKQRVWLPVLGSLDGWIDRYQSVQIFSKYVWFPQILLQVI